MIYKKQIQDVETGESASQVTFIAESLRLLASVAACQGDDTVARTLYEESLIIAGEINYKWYIASCLEDLASMVAIQGQPACAARLLDMARFLYASAYMPLPSAERAASDRTLVALRAHLGERDIAAARAEGRTLLPEQTIASQGPEPMAVLSRTAPPSTTSSKTLPAYPAGLTAREVDVLCLVAQGLTDAQVAEQLVISPRTVNWHLTSIYSKLQVSSRSAATRYAIQHTLV